MCAPLRPGGWEIEWDITDPVGFARARLESEVQQVRLGLNVSGRILTPRCVFGGHDCTVTTNTLGLEFEARNVTVTKSASARRVVTFVRTIQADDDGPKENPVAALE